MTSAHSIGRATRGYGSGVVSSRCVIEFNGVGGVRPFKSSSVGEVAGGKLRVLIVYAQSMPSPRDTASVDAPGVLPERASHQNVPLLGRGPFPHTACRWMT
jgi:hypothetical protein